MNFMRVVRLGLFAVGAVVAIQAVKTAAERYYASLTPEQWDEWFKKQRAEMRKPWRKRRRKLRLRSRHS